LPEVPRAAARRTLGRARFYKPSGRAPSPALGAHAARGHVDCPYRAATLPEIRVKPHIGKSRTFLVTAALSLPSAAIVTSALRPAEPQEEIRITGSLGGWRIDADRRVHFLVTRADEDIPRDDEGKPKEKGIESELEVWFHTPPDRDVEREFNAMILAALFAVERAPAGTTITVTAKVERQLDGKTADKSLPLLSLSRP
jgi:hypothetical protein